MFLCIDTITEFSGVTLVSNEACLAYQALDLGSASDSVLVKIDEVLTESQVSISDLEGVYVVKGPGSFTGLRVGIAVANQFAHQLKIPIQGIRTDEWFSARTDEADFLYLQTLNRDELYVKGFGKLANQFDSIVELSVLRGEASYLGQFKYEHEEKLPEGFKLLSDLRNPAETWFKVTQKNPLSAQREYELVTPFYGKEPTITKSSRKLGL